MHKRGFTLIELLVVIAVIAVLAAILFPVFVRARVQARIKTCLNNQKQLGCAVMLYAGDWNDKFPYANNWYDRVNQQIKPYNKNNAIYRCPITQWTNFEQIFAGTGFHYRSYHYRNRFPVFPPPPYTVKDEDWYKNFFQPSIPGASKIALFWDEFAYLHQNEGINAIFCDAHAKSISVEALRVPNDNNGWLYMRDISESVPPGTAEKNKYYRTFIQGEPRVPLSYVSERPTAMESR